MGRSVLVAIGLAGAMAGLAAVTAPPELSPAAQAKRLVGVQVQPPAPAEGSRRLFDESIVRDFYLTFADPDWEARLAALQGSGDNLPARLEVEGRVYDRVGVRYKGNSSQRVPSRKKPFNITIDAFVEGQELLGYDVVNLNNGFADPTLVREVLTYHQLRPFLPMPQASYVRLHINGDYFGVYVLVQQIERTYLGEWFASNDGILFKADPPGGFGPPPGPRLPYLTNQQPSPPGIQQFRDGPRSDLTWLGEDLAAYRRSYDLKTTAAGDAGYERLREFIRVLDAPVSEGGVPDQSFAQAIRSQLDVDGALWYLAAHNLFTNFDSYYAGHNYYLYWAEEDQRFHLLSWDMNESFGVFGIPGVNPADSDSVVQADPFLRTADPESARRPLIRRLLAVEDFRADYLAHYRTLLATAYDPAKLEAQAADFQDLIRDAVASDPNLLYGVELFGRNLWNDVRLGSGRWPGGGRPVPGLLSLATRRHAWLAGRDYLQAPDHILVSHRRTPEQPTVGEEVKLEMVFGGTDVPVAVEVVLRLDGGRPVRLPMVQRDGSWQATIPGQPQGTQVTYYLRVSFADGGAAFHPAANATQPWGYRVTGPALPRQPAGALVVNELMADNETTIADGAGEFDDWVELYNRGRVEVSLAGYYLSDDPDDLLQYALPEVTLPPGGYFLVWCDNDPDQGPDHAGFRLNRAGEAVYLSTTEAIVDAVTFGPQEADVSFGRVVDGANDWGPCDRPSPRAANRCQAAEGGRIYLPLTATGGR